ncbi:hypothetical protein [Rickettsiella endosymbiont of Miltochrista miniata]|uniref:hypothetical protein n=1 Tax=Rickettsiella endosymbiont of Miltochrista miniata TaxID=3066239 RepID=UPI00313B0D86
MAKIKQQKITELQKNLAKKIKQLKDEIKKLPAYVRRKKDEKNWETFFLTFAFISLTGIMIFGTGGWLAVAASGALLTLIIVESGLFLSLAIGFSAWPVYNVYLWARDLLSAEKIKSQNKDYDQCHKNLIELKALAAEKNYLSAKINFKLNNAIKCFPSGLFAQENANFAQLGLTDQIHRLEQQKKKLPAYSRKQKDKHIWDKIFRYSAAISCAGLGLYAIAFIMTAGASASIVMGPVFPVLVIIEAINVLIIIGPVLVSSVLHASYLCIRDLFSSAEIKAKNKEYAQLKKTISELKKLDKQDSQLDEKINSKLHELEDTKPSQTSDEKETTKNLSVNTENKKNEYVYKLFQEPIVPANETDLIKATKLSSLKVN